MVAPPPFQVIPAAASGATLRRPGRGLIVRVVLQCGMTRPRRQNRPRPRP